jgi:integrase
VCDQVRIGGQIEPHAEGNYFIEWYEGGKRHRQSVGEFSLITEAARRKSIKLNALKAGLIHEMDKSEPTNARLGIGKAIDDYLEFVKAHRKSCTFLTYRYTLDVLLRESYQKPYADQMTREDMLQFMTDCYKRGLGQRTVYDKVVVVLQMFKRYGKSGLLEANDWPEYVETIRPIYEAEELEAIFKVATESEATLVRFLLGSGFRDQKIRYLMWRDVDFKSYTVRVTAKPQWKFTLKNWEERSVPLLTGLIDRLRKLKGDPEWTPCAVGLSQYARQSGQRDGAEHGNREGRNP